MLFIFRFVGLCLCCVGFVFGVLFVDFLRGFEGSDTISVSSLGISDGSVVSKSSDFSDITPLYDGESLESPDSTPSGVGLFIFISGNFVSGVCF